jgi:predicted enzyme related to lactoylglutathione lyase
MNKLKYLALVAGMVIASASQAEVTLNSVRVLAKDAEALGRFYEDAFGLRETNRLAIADGVELFLNFGATMEAARANASPRIVIMQNPDGVGDDSAMHVIFNVTDAQATARAVVAAGGSVEREPTPYGDSGMMIGFVIDPEGNHIELIQPAAR